MNLLIIRNLFIIFVMILVGLFSGRAKLFSEKAQDDFTTFLMKIALPCLIVSSMIREYDRDLIRDSILIFILGIVIFGGLNLINRRVAGLLKISPERRGVWTVSTSMCNIGFMGFPILLAVFGSKGLFLGSIMNIAYNIISWTVCAIIVADDPAKKEKINWKKILCTNTNYAVVIGLFFFLTQIKVPEPVVEILTSFGGITTPLSMFLIGLSLAGSRLADIFRDREILLCTGIRLIVVPAIIACLMKVFPVGEGSLLPGVVTMIMAMPCPSMGIILAQIYKKDVTMAAGAIFLSSLCCIVTIPLIMLLL